jgi:predicted DNA-binding transcriptional regulator YafY
MNRIDRLLGIILLLQSKKIVRATDISKFFNKSKRTIYRDLQALSEIGVPLSAEPGEGYSLVEGYHLPPVMFTHGEASALLLGTEFVIKKSDAFYRKEAQSALLKIKSILKKDTKEYINKIDESTIIFEKNISGKNILQSIQNSIANNTLIHIKYFSLSKNEITDRDIEPVGLIHYAENWRIIAYCCLRKDFREFRINRIKSINFLTKKFSIRKNFVLNDFISENYKIKNPFEAKILFDKKASRVVKEKYPQGLIKEETHKNGVLMTFIYSKDNLNRISNWILSFGKDAKVISPIELKKNVSRKVNELAEIYSKN